MPNQSYRELIILKSILFSHEGPLEGTLDDYTPTCRGIKGNLIYVLPKLLLKLF
jgi:hypothetical protein